MEVKLFIDDLREPWPDWHCARTITEAIRVLASIPVEIVSLDHDIACSHNGCFRGEFETFEPVARYIALMNPRPIVQFHTGNMVGGQQMAALLGIEYNYTAYKEPENL